MKTILSGKVVLVTGGTGSIGSELVRQALAQDARQVIVFSRDEIKHFTMRQMSSDERLETFVGDIRDLRSIEEVFKRYRIDIVYHAAAMKHVVMCEDFPLETVRTNIQGTQNIVDLALQYGVSGMITISTDKAAHPANVMGASKFIAERVTLNANRLSGDDQSFSCVRFGNVANSRGSVIPVYMDALVNRRPLQITDPEVTRFIIEISDAVGLVIKATQCAQGGEVFILKMRAFKLGDLLDIMINRIAPRLEIPEQSIKIKRTGLVSGEKLHEDLTTDAESARVWEWEDMYVLLPDNSRSDMYPRLVKSNLQQYTSCNVELISGDQIESLVVKYLESQNRS